MQTDRDAEVQAIFDKVIREGFYPSFSSLEGMCFCLAKAKKARLITEQERELANYSIGIYLQHHPAYLSMALKLTGLPFDMESCLAIYKDWKNRPVLPRFD